MHSPRNPCTTPEELIAASNAGCFAMVFMAELGKVGFTPERVTARTGCSISRLLTSAITLDATLEA